MNESEVKTVLKYIDKGKCFSEISIIMGIGASTLTKWVRNYRVYGKSLFTDTPTEITSSFCDDTEFSSVQSSPFSSWLSQQETSRKQSSES